MCGRVNVSDNEGIRLVLAMLGMDTWPGHRQIAEPRYNIAPTRLLGTLAADKPVPVLMRWGLTPTWAAGSRKAPPLINARSETVREKRSFRHLIGEHRAVVPINGFYEWRREGKTRTAFHIRHAELPALLLAAIHQPASGNDSESTGSDGEVCLMTTAANEDMQPVHDRMPVILSPDEARIWLEHEDTDTLDALMKPAANGVLNFRQVTGYVNDARHEGPECLADSGQTQSFDF